MTTPDTVLDATKRLPTFSASPLAMALCTFAIPLNHPDDTNDRDLSNAFGVADAVLKTKEGEDRFHILTVAIEEYARTRHPRMVAELDKHQGLDEPLSLGEVQNAFSFPSLLIGFALAYRLLAGSR